MESINDSINTGFTDKDWKYLFYYINQKNLTPLLGAGISQQYFGSGKELAAKVAEQFEYPFEDTYNLAKVSQFAAIQTEDSNMVREYVAKYIKSKELSDKELLDINDDAIDPHKILADLDLPIYITTNYDHLMYKALENNGKKPILEFCRWNNLKEIQGVRSIFDENKVNHFDASTPLVYHLHGEIDNPQSMVLTEDDYLNFIVKLYVDIDKLLPAEIKMAFVSSSIMFIGYSLSDWNLRIILRRIADGMKSASRTHCSIQLSPTDFKIYDENTIREYLKSYFKIIQGVNLKIFWGNAMNFCRNLRDKKLLYF